MRGPQGPSLGPAVRGGRLVLLVLTVLMLTTLMATSEARMQRCQRPPPFSVNGAQPMTLAGGQVTLVALLTNTCTFCIGQARALELLHTELQAAGTPVHMMLIDAGPPGTNVFEEIVSFNVYQDDDRQRMWRQVFKGTKDDIIIFNRCGMMTYHLWYPYSYLGYNYVRLALNLTANDHSLCEDCLLRDPHETMMGDAPAAEEGIEAGHHSHSHSSHRGHSGRGHHHRGRRPEGHSHHSHRNNNPNSSRRSANRSRCPRDDALCRELRRGRRRLNRFRKQHLLTQNPDVNEEEILALLARRSGNRYFPRMPGGAGGGGGGAVAGAAPVA